MRDVGHESAGVGLHPPQLTDLPLQRARGVVEGPRHVRQLVGAPNRQPGAQIALTEAARRPAEVADGSQHAAGGQQGQQDGEDQGQAAGHPRPVGETVDALLLGREVAHRVDLQPGGPGRAVGPVEFQLGADEQPGLPVERDTLPGDPAVADLLPQLGGERVGEIGAAPRPHVPVDDHREALPVGETLGQQVQIALGRRKLGDRVDLGDLVGQRHHRGVLRLLEDDGPGLEVAAAGHDRRRGHAQQRERQEQPDPQARDPGADPAPRCHSGPNRYPKPRTVWMKTGADESASILARTRWTQASTSRESPR